MVSTEVTEGEDQWHGLSILHFEFVHEYTYMYMGHDLRFFWWGYLDGYGFFIGKFNGNFEIAVGRLVGTCL